jgi:thioredoxin reductase (NADPH)
MEEHDYDVIIVGTGPAGITAALYGQRLGLRTIVFGDLPGGITYMIENLANFPGFLEGISGTEFGVKLFQQAQMEGAMFTMARLDRLEKNKDTFVAIDTNGLSYTAPSAILASGRVPRIMPGTRPELKGVNFCSVCDGPLFRDKNATLAVVGSDNAAAQHAVTLSRVAEKVFLICRSQTLKMDAAHKNLIAKSDNIETLVGTEVLGYEGLDMVESLCVKAGNGKSDKIPVEGVFLSIGWTPGTEVLKIEAKTNREGYLITDESLKTSVPGLFAAGDVREKTLYQVLTACSDGAVAAQSVSGYLNHS